MKTENKVLMAQARESLKGKWGLSIGALVVYMAISIVIGLIPKIGSLISFFISGPLMLGFTAFFLAVSRKETVKVSQVFEGFNSFWKAVGTYLLMSLLIGISFIPLAIPMAIFFFAHPTSILVILIGVILFVVAMIPAVWMTFSLSMVFYILVDKKDIKVVDSLRESAKIMKGNKKKLFYLGLRFIGWMLLSILTLGIGLLWLMPYVYVSTAKFYDDIKDKVAQPTPEPTPAVV